MGPGRSSSLRIGGDPSAVASSGRTRGASDRSAMVELQNAPGALPLPSPPSTMRVSPIGPSAANPTKGELLAQLETLSRKPRSVKRKTSGTIEKGRPALAKVPRLGASSSSPSTPARKSEWAQSPTAEAPIVLSSQPPSKSTTKGKSLLGGATEQPLTIMPITVWNPPTESFRSPPRRAEELKRKATE